jgi:hypothetical protein
MDQVTPLSSVLGMGPSDGVKEHTGGEDGILRRTQKAEAKDNPRNVPPFPFRKDCFVVGQTQIKLLREVWDHTGKIKDDYKKKKSKKNTENVEQGEDNSDSSSDSGEGENEEDVD